MDKDDKMKIAKKFSLSYKQVYKLYWDFQERHRLQYENIMFGSKKMEDSNSSEMSVAPI